MSWNEKNSLSFFALGAGDYSILIISTLWFYVSSFVFIILSNICSEIGELKSSLLAPLDTFTHLFGWRHYFFRLENFSVEIFAEMVPPTLIISSYRIHKQRKWNSSSEVTPLNLTDARLFSSIISRIYEFGSCFYPAKRNSACESMCNISMRSTFKYATILWPLHQKAASERFMYFNM